MKKLFLLIIVIVSANALFAQTVNLPKMSPHLVDSLETNFPRRISEGQIHYGGKPSGISKANFKRNQDAFYFVLTLLGEESLRADRAEAALAEKSAEADSLRNALNDANAENDSLRQALNEAIAENDELRKEVATANLRIELLLAELKSISAKLDQLLAEANKWEPKMFRFDMGAGVASLLEWNYYDRPETTGMMFSSTMLIGNPNQFGPIGYLTGTGAQSFTKSHIDPNGAGQATHPNGFEEKTMVNGHYLHGSGGGLLNIPLMKAQSAKDSYLSFQAGIGANGLQQTRPERKVWTGSYGLEGAGGFILGNETMEFRFLTNILIAGNTHNPDATDDAFSGFSFKLTGLFFKKHVGFFFAADMYDTRQPDTVTYAPWGRGESGLTSFGGGLTVSF